MNKAKLVAFDLDNTLAPSKEQPSRAIVEQLKRLLDRVPVAIISGASFEQFKEQFIEGLSFGPKFFEKLYLMPTNGGMLYTYANGIWNCIFSMELGHQEKERIQKAFSTALNKVKFDFGERAFGERLEDRGGQFTFSALGQSAPLELKESFDPDKIKRKKIQKELEKLLPDYDIAIGGTTSIDITKKGINKEYAIKKLVEVLQITDTDIIFVGDSFGPGGNDTPVERTKAKVFQVKNPEETISVIDIILAEYV